MNIVRDAIQRLHSPVLALKIGVFLNEVVTSYSVLGFSDDEDFSLLASYLAIGPIALPYCGDVIVAVMSVTRSSL